MSISNFSSFLFSSSPCMQVLVICPTSDRKVEVEHFISERTHKLIALRFWVRVWCLSHLYGCLDVGGPPGSPRDPTVVSEPWFDEGFDRLLVSKVLLTKGVQAAGSVVGGDNSSTSISVCGWKSSAWGVSMMNWWTHTWGWDCCVQVWVICPTSDRKVEVEHFISERTHKLIALMFWVRVWYLSHLYGCCAGGPPGSPRDPTICSSSRSQFSVKLGDENNFILIIDKQSIHIALVVHEFCGQIDSF